VVDLVISLAKFSEIIISLNLSFGLFTPRNLGQRVEQGYLSTPEGDKLRLSVYFDAFNPPVCRNVRFEASL